MELSSENHVKLHDDVFRLETTKQGNHDQPITQLAHFATPKPTAFLTEPDDERVRWLFWFRSERSLDVVQRWGERMSTVVVRDLLTLRHLIHSLCPEPGQYSSS